MSNTTKATMLDLLHKRKPQNNLVGDVASVVMNPPYSAQWNCINDQRFDGYGLAPKSKADFAFLLHGLSKIKHGRMAILLPHGVLFRGQAEEKIRKAILERNILEGVIGLPGNLFHSTSIPTAILVLNFNKLDNNLYFIDATEMATKVTKLNVIAREHVNTILEAYLTRKNKERFGYVAGPEEIQGNDYNLNIPRYVDTYVPEDLPPLWQICEELEKIDKQIEECERELRVQVRELVASTEEAQEDLDGLKEYYRDKKDESWQEIMQEFYKAL